jgi:hypothetical protein
MDSLFPSGFFSSPSFSSLVILDILGKRRRRMKETHTVSAPITQKGRLKGGI